MSGDVTRPLNDAAGQDGEARKPRRSVVGIVKSDKMDKTIVVHCDRMVQHPVFKKYLRRTTKYVAHDETNEAGHGDRVEIMECRPLSKTKRFRLVRIIERSRMKGIEEASAP